MENRNPVRNITIKDLWEIFIRYIAVIAAAAVICTAVFFAVTRFAFDPVYKSTATLYILRQNENPVGASASSDFSLALNVVNDCTYLLKSRAVVDEVKEKLNLDIDYEDLSKAISTSNPENTRILEVTVKADSPELAKDIVDAVCEVGAEKIASAMGFNQVNMFEYGTIENEPSNHTRLVTCGLVGALGAVITYLIFLVVFLLDDCIRTDEDIENYLGLSVLGDIPNVNAKVKKRYGYYSPYDRRNSTKGKKEDKIWKR